MTRVWILLLLLLAACTADPSAEQTAAAINSTLGTQVAIRRVTSTHDADRRFVTQSALETAAALAQRRQGQIISTLAELEFPTPDVRLITPAALPTNPAFALITPTPDVFETASGGITRAAPTSDPLETPATTTPTPGPATQTPDPSLPRVENVVTSTGVGSDDCANGVTGAFSAQSSAIYIVATAFNVPRGATIASRWLRDSEELARFEFAPDFEINGACIWFFADQTDFTFTAGSYRVEIEISGVVAGAAEFSVQ